MTEEKIFLEKMQKIHLSDKEYDFVWGRVKRIELTKEEINLFKKGLTKLKKPPKVSFIYTSVTHEIEWEKQVENINNILKKLETITTKQEI